MIRLLSPRRVGAMASGVARRQTRLQVGAAAVVLGIIGLVAWVAFDARQAALDHAIQTSENLASALSHDIARSIETFDLSLQAVGDGLRLPEIWTVGPELRDSVLFDRSTTAKYLGAIMVFDENGNGIIESGSFLPPNENVANDAIFAHHRDSADLGLHIGVPFKSGASGEWAIGGKALSTQDVKDLQASGK